MAKKSKARIERDRDARRARHKANVDNVLRHETGTPIVVDEDETFRQLSKLRPGLTYPELTAWVQGMSEAERDKTLASCAKAIVNERR